MTETYAINTLTDDDRERLERVHDDLLSLSNSDVPSVRAAARAALAHVAQALNGQGISYTLYSNRWSS